MKTKQRTLAVLLVLVLGLGGLLWFVSRSNAAEEAASSAAAEGSILLSSFAAGDVTSIRYAYGGETLTLNYDFGSWTLADDPDYHLDASACNTMVTALASLNAKRQLTAQPGEDYGLADPAVTVTVTAAGETEMFSARPERARTVLYSASCFSEYSEKSSETKSKPPKSAFAVASVDFCSGERAVLRSRSRNTSGSFKNALPES